MANLTVQWTAGVGPFRERSLNQQIAALRLPELASAATDRRRSREEMVNLKYIVAKIAFGTVNADEIQAAVDSLLADGTYFYEFIDIMDSKPARLDEMLPPFTSFLNRKKISIPSKDQAVWQLIEYGV